MSRIETERPMTIQEQAFRCYYASMTDAELLRTAGNKRSFVDIEQKLLAAELLKRNLIVPPAEPFRPNTSGQMTPAVSAQPRLAAIKSALVKLRMRPSSKK